MMAATTGASDEAMEAGAEQAASATGNSTKTATNARAKCIARISSWLGARKGQIPMQRYRHSTNAPVSQKAYREAACTEK